MLFPCLGRLHALVFHPSLHFGWVLGHLAPLSVSILGILDQLVMVKITYRCRYQACWRRRENAMSFPCLGRLYALVFHPSLLFGWVLGYLAPHSVSIVSISGQFVLGKITYLHMHLIYQCMIKNARVFPCWGGLHALVHHPRSSFGCAFGCVAACFKLLGAYFGVVALWFMGFQLWLIKTYAACWCEWVISWVEQGYESVLNS